MEKVTYDEILHTLGKRTAFEAVEKELRKEINNQYEERYSDEIRTIRRLNLLFLVVILLQMGSLLSILFDEHTKHVAPVGAGVVGSVPRSASASDPVVPAADSNVISSYIDAAGNSNEVRKEPNGMFEHRYEGCDGSKADWLDNNSAPELPDAHD